MACIDLHKKPVEEEEKGLKESILLNHIERKWINSRGLGDVFDFTDDEIAKIKHCFLSLDDDESGAVGIDELEGPLIGLGFYETREEVIEMIESVDDDGSGQIEFGEFLTLIRNAENS